jgi:hypothetical protein
VIVDHSEQLPTFVIVVLSEQLSTYVLVLINKKIKFLEMSPLWITGRFKLNYSMTRTTPTPPKSKVQRLPECRIVKMPPTETADHPLTNVTLTNYSSMIKDDVRRLWSML